MVTKINLDLVRQLTIVTLRHNIDKLAWCHTFIGFILWNKQNGKEVISCCGKKIEIKFALGNNSNWPCTYANFSQSWQKTSAYRHSVLKETLKGCRFISVSSPNGTAKGYIDFYGRPREMTCNWGVFFTHSDRLAHGVVNAWYKYSRHYL